VASDPSLIIFLRWTKLAGKTWQALNSHGEKGVEIKHDELGYLDYQINQWYEQAAENLKLGPNTSERQMQYANVQYLQVVLFVRKSHLLNLIYRPILQLSSRIHQNLQQAEAGVRIAKESIQVVSELNKNTILIRKHALFFKHLVLTAFGNLLLAVVNASSVFWESVRKEFDTALNLIKFLSARSAPMLRLWKRLEGLRDLQAKIFRASSVPSIEASDEDRRDNPLGGLSLEELFPPFPDVTAELPAPESSTYDTGDLEMREHLNNLFDASMGYDIFFDFPYVE
jgi:hypothetical protein